MLNSSTISLELFHEKGREGITICRFNLSNKSFYEFSFQRCKLSHHVKSMRFSAINYAIHKMPILNLHIYLIDILISIVRKKNECILQSVLWRYVYGDFLKRIR